MANARKLAKQVWEYQGTTGNGKGGQKGQGKGSEWDDHMADEEDVPEGDGTDSDWAKPLTREIEDKEEQIQKILKGKIERMPLKVQMGKKEAQVETMRFKIAKNQVLLESRREQMEKATEAFREVEETLDRQSGKLGEWQDESRVLKGRREKEIQGEEANSTKGCEKNGELTELLEAAQKSDPMLVQNLLEQLRKAMAGGPPKETEAAGSAGRKNTRAKGEDGGVIGGRDRSRSPPGRNGEEPPTGPEGGKK